MNQCEKLQTIFNRHRRTISTFTVFAPDDKKINRLKGIYYMDTPNFGLAKKFHSVDVRKA